VSERWVPQGVVVEAPLPLPWAASHAALPVVSITSDQRLRLFCSSRDAEGRSHIAAGWLDLEHGRASFDEAASVTTGTLGAFDDRGVTSSSVVNHDGRVYQYYTGWNLGVTVPFYLAIGCAISDDGGETFEKVSGAPVLGRSTVDAFLTASPSVHVEDGVWRMWYVSGTGWLPGNERRRPQPRYHIRYADSSDGIHWSPTGHVCIDYRDEQETSIGRPCVLKDGALYRMWFCARGESYQLGYAESRDGLVWVRKDEEIDGVTRAGFDSEMQAYPFVFDHRGERHMLYNGNGYGSTGIGHAAAHGNGAPGRA
jgi:hypothetical protein